MLGLLLPHGDKITWTGYGYNLGLATLGNIVGGAIFVAGMYWVGSPKARDAVTKRSVAPAPNGVLADNTLVPVGEA
jgi:nitrite transporter NirC